MKRLLVAALLLFLAALPVFFLHWRTIRFDPLIEEYSSRYELDFHLVKSIIWKESGFNPSAQGGAGELGLMQIMPFVGQEFWERNRRPGDYDPEWLLIPEHNIEVGCWYLRDSLDLYRDQPDPVPFALARYNAGQSRVMRWMETEEPNRVLSGEDFIDRIDFPLTREYVRRVMDRSSRRSGFYLW